MSERDLDIAPAEVPLTHRETAPAAPEQSTANWQAPAGLALLLVGGALLLWWAGSDGRGEHRSTVVTAPASTGTPGTQTTAPTSTTDPALPPFAASQQALARDRAQAALARFVEQQMALEEAMSVAAWGQQAFDQALADAAAGDEAFVDERFEVALAAYDQAAQALTALIAEGEQRIAQALADGDTALDDRREDRAREAFQTALVIDPENETAKAGLARADKLPQVQTLLLQARNQELAGQWQRALSSYDEIAALDERTAGLAKLRADAQAAVGDKKLRDTLSDGFAALDARRYNTARKAFNAALQLDPGNEIALGGLQQVSARTELSRMAQLEKEAAAAVRSEDWPRAIKAYEEALRLDGNIQFAKAGLGTARAQAAAASTLQEIVDEPNKLSSQTRMDAGREALAQARQLEPQGDQLRSLIERSAALLDAYAQPVTVQLTSDNQTQVLVSTVGKLGTFANRELQLRPGEYVLLGSRSGCRDVRRTVVVAPRMAPVDIRCEERLP
ncbi:MAG: hypothetical protein AAGI15_14150 [Pseudomonadota bacterium]